MDNQTTANARYSRGAAILHWLIALLIVLNVAAAWISDDMPKPERAFIMGNHKAIGILILALTVLRIVWRIVKKPPPLVETLKAWEAALSKVTHAGFYFLMLALPLSGWAMTSSFTKGEGVSLFGLFTMPALPVAYDKATSGMFHEMHEIFGYLMVALFVLHVVAALKHQVIDKDGTLRRMVPWLA